MFKKYLEKSYNNNSQVEKEKRNEQLDRSAPLIKLEKNRIEWHHYRKLFEKETDKIENKIRYYMELKKQNIKCAL